MYLAHHLLVVNLKSVATEKTSIVLFTIKYSVTFGDVISSDSLK